jgi:type III secretory pathway component EscS
MTESSKKFLVYLTSYLGVALIGGSIVHVGTLDAHSTRYIVLGIVGFMLMIVGSILEAQAQKEPLNLKFFGITTALAVSTGFLSGGVQHYLDNPIYAGYLLAIGLVVAYVAFVHKYHFAISSRAMVTALVLGVMIIVFSNTVLHDVIPHEVGGGHQH